MRKSLTAHFIIGLLSLQLVAGSVLARHTAGVALLRGSNVGARQDEGVYDNFAKALREPEKVRRLVLQGEESLGWKSFPPGLGSLVNLEGLEFACMEQLGALPDELGKLSKLEEIIIDNGNGCAMNVALPRSIGGLSNLRVLRLYGALDGRDVGGDAPSRRVKNKPIPDTLANLQKLEELDLGRNGITSLPPQVASLRGLKKLSLDYNDIRVLPDFVGELPNLEELSVNANGGVRLPPSLAKRKGLKVYMGNNRLTLVAQRQLRARFPNATFSFENEYDDDAANQEAPKPKRKGR
ncbi:MAG TPA: hypothetical protein VF297_30195 [Pyrinomonadaceae bacterium]